MDDSTRLAPSAPTAHRDTFVRDRLPPEESWPDLEFGALPGLRYPDRLNCAAALLDQWAESARSNRTAVLGRGIRWSYRDLYERANRIAHVLVDDLGLVPGNRVLLRGDNEPMMAALWYGVVKAGGICVTTMPLDRKRELSRVIGKARVQYAFTDAELADELEAAADEASSMNEVVRFHAEGPESLGARMRDKPETFDAVDTAADDPAIIGFTSGTTGQPKGTVHFHRDILAITDTFSRYVLSPEADDVFCGSPPLAFTFGLGGLLLFPHREGAASLLLRKGPVEDLLAGIEDYGATICFTAPTAYRAMAEQADDYDLSSLRKCVSAGEDLPLPIYEEWKEATGIRMINGIGTTEMLHIFVSAAGDDIRPGATGIPVPGYEARVVSEDGERVSPGTVGRLAVRGPTGCRYLDDEDQQREYVQDGWNMTGDAFVMDEDGYFWYKARTDDMIISAGYNIAGPEVEGVLLDHDAVLECGVIGADDEERGEIVKACVKLRDGYSPGEGLVEELQDFVKREMAPYKYPRAIAFVDELPRTQTGKLQRFRLREIHG